MSKKRISRPERKMKPVFLVFCEGETEDMKKVRFPQDKSKYSGITG
jgi:hypothetical protein